MMQRGIRTYVALVAATIFLIFSRGMIPFGSAKYAGFDLHDYRFIAQAAPRLSPEASAPFAYRLLGPYVVGLLPIPDPLAFRIVTSIACLALVILLYRFLMDEGIESYFAAVAALLFACNRYFFGLMVWDPFQIDDVLAMVCMVVSLMLLARRHWIAFAVCFALGCLTREVVMILIPVSFVYLWERGTIRPEFKRWFAAICPAITVFLVVRASVYADGARMGITGILPYYEMKFGESAGHAFTLAAWLRRLIWCFMPFTFLPLVFLKTTLSFFSRHKYVLFYLALVIVTDFWGIDQGGGDAERQMAPAFLAFFWLIGVIAQNRLSRPRWVLPLILATGFLGSLHHLQTVYPLPSKLATLVVTIVAATVATGIGFWIAFSGTGNEILVATSAATIPDLSGNAKQNENTRSVDQE